MAGGAHRKGSGRARGCAEGGTAPPPPERPRVPLHQAGAAARAERKARGKLAGHMLKIANDARRRAARSAEPPAPSNAGDGSGAFVPAAASTRSGSGAEERIGRARAELEQIEEARRRKLDELQRLESAHRTRSTAQDDRGELQALALDSPLHRGPPKPSRAGYLKEWRDRRQAIGLSLGGTAKKEGVYTKSPFRKAELISTNDLCYESFDRFCFGDETFFLPRGILPEGMTGPPERMVECFGSKLGVQAPDVAKLALRAIEGACLKRPYGPLRATALARWATSLERRVGLNLFLSGSGTVDARFVRQRRAEGKFRRYVHPLPPGCAPENEPGYDYTMDPAKKTCVCSQNGNILAVHLPGLFKAGDGLERLAAVVACAAVAMPFSTGPSRLVDPDEDRPRLDAAREAAEAALRTGSLDVMRAKLAELGPPRAVAARAPKKSNKKAKKRKKKADSDSSDEGGEEEELRGPHISTGFQRGQGSSVPKPVQLNAQLGEDPLKNKRLQLLNGYLAGLFEYLFPALCEVDLAAACAMAEICFNLLRRHPYIYGFWAMQWINSSEWKSRAHQDKNDAKESLAALIYFHREGDSGARLHKLRFPDLGIALELRHGDVVFIKGSILKHQVVSDDQTKDRYCIVLTLGKNLKVDAEPQSPAPRQESQVRATRAASHKKGKAGARSAPASRKSKAVETSTDSRKRLAVAASTPEKSAKRRKN